MNLKKEIEKHKYTQYEKANGTICYQNVKELVTLKDGQWFGALYLHELYKGLNSRDLEAFKRQFNFELHKDLLNFMKIYNGVNLFSNTFAIYGFGKTFSNGSYYIFRDIENPMPFDMANENSRKVQKEELKIGSICDFKMYLNNVTGVVTYKNNDGSIIKEWKSLPDCIKDVFKKLDSQYLPNGLYKELNFEKESIFNQPDFLEL